MRHSSISCSASVIYDGVSNFLNSCALVVLSFTGGAPVFPGLLRKAKQLCAQAKITAVYGSTEAEPMAEIALSDISREDFDAMEKGKGLVTGRPVSSISLRVIGEQWGVPILPLDARTFEQLTRASGELGEIVVSGGHVFPAISTEKATPKRSSKWMARAGIAPAIWAIWMRPAGFGSSVDATGKSRMHEARSIPLPWSAPRCRLPGFDGLHWLPSTDAAC
jgi:hypothetical protein